jgi:short subunit dehydrogenase-like uncharacterized protein
MSAGRFVLYAARPTVTETARPFNHYFDCAWGRGPVTIASMSDPFVVYGATGYTGTLVALEARACGFAPILGGRNEEKLRVLSSSLALESRAASVDDSAQLARLLDGVRVVLNAAGPFSATASALAGACLRAGVHYLDVTGEVRVIDALAGSDAEARRRGVMVMPAVGFDVAASDCLALHVTRRASRGKRLFIGIAMPPLADRFGPSSNRSAVPSS